MKIQYITIVTLFFFSCSQTKMLQKSLSKYTVPIDYLHDSKPVSSPKTDYLYVKLKNQSMDSITSATKLKGKVLPFLFFNYIESNLGVNLGQSSIRNNYNDFFYRSLLEESKRSACFDIGDNPNDSTYTLEITVDTCSTKSRYRSSTTVLFLVFAYSMSNSESGSPAETYLHVSTKLKKGDLLVVEKSYNIRRSQPFLNSNPVDINKLRSDFTVNMVESLSLSTKQCIEEIINDTNTAINKDKPQARSGSF